MDVLGLAWETFDFHVACAINKELDLVKYIENFKNNLEKIPNASQDQKRILVVRNIRLYKKLSNCTDLLVNDYKKQNASLIELVDLNKHFSLNGISIPIERQVPIMYLHELKNTNITLIEQLKMQIKEFKSLLG